MLVLWLLLLRGLGIEFRHQIHHPMWEDAWDVIFSVASALLALLFGVALGNVLRGVPLNDAGEFRGTFALMLNPFAIVGGLLAVATLALHGASWAAMKVDGDLQLRARSFARVLWYPTAALLVAMIVASFIGRPGFTRNFLAYPFLLIWPVVAIGGLIVNMMAVRRGDDGRAFVASGAFIAGTLASVSAGLYPLLLPASPGSGVAGLDIYNSAAPPHSLQIALMLYLLGLAIVTVYLIYVYRTWQGRSGGAYH
jgi:cytochrome d ubiquinol oxidase subunit II